MGVLLTLKRLARSFSRKGVSSRSEPLIISFLRFDKYHRLVTREYLFCILIVDMLYTIIVNKKEKARVISKNKFGITSMRKTGEYSTINNSRFVCE